MKLLIHILFVIILLGWAVVGAAYFWRWFYSAETLQDETFYVHTKDGWKLALHHYQSVNPTGSPVVICHGLSSNRFMFDMPGSPSLAPYLALHGRDVWVFELRGAGLSDKPGLFASDTPYHWTFDDHLDMDLPPLIAKTLERTGAKQVHWIGYSMGGILMQAYLAKHHDAPIKSGIIIGSPTNFSKMKRGVVKVLLAGKGLFGKLPFFPFSILAKALIPFVPYMPANRFSLFNPENTKPETAKRSVGVASEITTSNSLWFQFGKFVETGEFTDPAGRPYLEGLPECRIPLLIMAGAGDSFTPVEAVTDPCGSCPNMECLTLGKTTGFSADYGHLDLIIGKRVEEEVYPLILKRLASQD